MSWCRVKNIISLDCKLFQHFVRNIQFRCHKFNWKWTQCLVKITLFPAVTHPDVFPKICGFVFYYPAWKLSKLLLSAFKLSGQKYLLLLPQTAGKYSSISLKKPVYGCKLCWCLVTNIWYCCHKHGWKMSRQFQFLGCKSSWHLVNKIRFSCH